MKAVFFDLDGTLTDPFDGISRSIRYALERLDVIAPPDNEMAAFIGPPLQQTFRTLVGEARAGRALELYRERYLDVGWQENEPYDGMHAALDAIGQRGTLMYVATTKFKLAAEKIVEHFGFEGYFRNVYGSEADGTRTDKTELLAWAIERERPPDPGAMVGDRHHDMHGGRNNNLTAIGVSYGYGSTEELSAAGAAAIAARPGDLPALLG